MFKKINIGNKIEDFFELLRIFRIVFEVKGEDPDSAQLLKLINKPDFLVFVINDQERVIGGLTIYIFDSYYGKKPQAYIYDVGISPQFQGKGYGKKLISEVFDYC